MRGVDIRDRPLEERRALLESARAAQAVLRTSEIVTAHDLDRPGRLCVRSPARSASKG